MKHKSMAQMNKERNLKKLKKVADAVIDKRRTLDSIIDIPTFRKFWIYDKPYGHDIVISADTGKTTIKCRWPDRERGESGRVRNTDA